MKLSTKYYCILFFHFAFLNHFTTAQLIDILSSDFGNVDLSELPDLSNITKLVGPNDFFTSLNPTLMKAVAELTSSFRAFQDPFQLAKVIQAVLKNSTVNRGVAVHGSFRTILTRDDREKFSFNSLETAPALWLSSDTMSSISSQFDLPSGQRKCVQVDGSRGVDNGPENILWYFRENIEMNSNHWNWHLVYPFDGTEAYVDRRGELFYYFHHGIVARYQAERLSNNLIPISAVHLLKGGIIPEGYNSHLTESNSKRNWEVRPWNQPVPDVVNASFINVTMNEYLLHRHRILEAIDSGSILLPDGSLQSIRNTNGTNVLGDLIEATAFSRNPEFYGSFGIHNEAHVFIGNSVHPKDPKSQFPRGLMSDTAVAMRDLIFYRWHLHVDDIIHRNKYTLPPYQRDEGEFPLSWPGVFIDDFHVRTKNKQQLPNRLFTFWGSAKYTLRGGLDFQRNNSNNTQAPVEICVKHLNHEEFEYQFIIRNTLGMNKNAAVRIFMAPRRDEHGLRYTMPEQHELFFVMDTFSLTLKNGSNHIIRQSTASTLTIPSAQVLDELNNDVNKTTPVCACGFPHHLLLPKGKPAGMEFDLFAMVTEESSLTSIPVHQPNARSTSSACKEAYLYCGPQKSTRKYPDLKPMGYPFDRRPFDNKRKAAILDVDEFVGESTNMRATVVGIFHINTIKTSSSMRK